MEIIEIVWSLIKIPFIWFGKVIVAFFKLDPVIQLIALLSISVGINGWQVVSHYSNKREHLIELAKLETKCEEEKEASKSKAIEIHNDRQSIWDLFVANAEADLKVRLSKIEKDKTKGLERHEKLVIQNPLPVDCKLAAPVVRNANETIRRAAHQKVQADL